MIYNNEAFASYDGKYVGVYAPHEKHVFYRDLSIHDVVDKGYEAMSVDDVIASAYDSSIDAYLKSALEF